MTMLERPTAAARLLGVPPRTLLDAIDAGRIPTTLSPSGRRQVDMDDVRRWAATRQRGPGRPPVRPSTLDSGDAAG